MSCAMIYWGKYNQRFYNIFIEYGAVVDISNLMNKKIGLENIEQNHIVFV
jgi:hypothetical protein